MTKSERRMNDEARMTNTSRSQAPLGNAATGAPLRGLCARFSPIASGARAKQSFGVSVPKRSLGTRVGARPATLPLTPDPSPGGRGEKGVASRLHHWGFVIRHSFVIRISSFVVAFIASADLFAG